MLPLELFDAPRGTLELSLTAPTGTVTRAPPAPVQLRAAPPARRASGGKKTSSVVVESADSAAAPLDTRIQVPTPDATAAPGTPERGGDSLQLLTVPTGPPPLHPIASASSAAEAKRTGDHEDASEEGDDRSAHSGMSGTSGHSSSTVARALRSRLADRYPCACIVLYTHAHMRFLSSLLDLFALDAWRIRGLGTIQAC